MSEHQSPVPRVEVSLYFDGSVRPVHEGIWEPQIGWFAIAFGTVPLFAAESTKLKIRRAHNPALTEWEALKAGLEWVRKLRSVDRLAIYGDSESVIAAVNRGTVNSGLHAATQALQLLKDMDVPFRASWVPRAGNGLADRLSRGTHADLLEIALRLVPLPARPAVPAPEDPAERERLTRALAEQLWRAAGCPHGQDERFWFAAEDVLRAARVVTAP